MRFLRGHNFRPGDLLNADVAALQEMQQAIERALSLMAEPPLELIPGPAPMLRLANDTGIPPPNIPGLASLIGPVTISTSQSNYAAPRGQWLIINATVNINITGFAAALTILASSTTSLWFELINVGTGVITLKANSSSSSSGNRIATSDGNDVTIHQYEGRLLKLIPGSPNVWIVAEHPFYLSSATIANLTVTGTLDASGGVLLLPTASSTTDQALWMTTCHLNYRCAGTSYVMPRLNASGYLDLNIGGLNFDLTTTPAPGYVTQPTAGGQPVIMNAALGSVPYFAAGGAPGIVGPNTAATLKLLAETGTGTVGATPAWVTFTTALGSGTIPPANGGTGSDLSATGPGYLVQASSGANVTGLTGTSQLAGWGSGGVPAAVTVGTGLSLSAGTLSNTATAGLPGVAQVTLLAKSNITLSGEQVIDGALTSGTRVGAVGQTTASQNGLYTTDSGAWTRTSDFAAGLSASGLAFLVLKGTSWKSTFWTCASVPGSDVVGTNNLTFDQVGAASVEYVSGSPTVATNISTWNFNTAVGAILLFGNSTAGEIDVSMPTVPKNTGLFGPTTGSDAIATMRTVVAADLPALNGITAPTGDVSLNSHKLTSVTDPTANQDAATKNYVDMAVAALAAKNDVQAATVAALAAATYNNGSSGVGATLTLTVAAVLVLDGYTPALNDRLLIKNQASAFQNGLYSLTVVGVLGVTQAVLTRTTDFNQPADGINGALVYVLNGTANANTLWSCTTDATVVFGTTSINWFQFQGTTYTADETTLHLAGTTFSVKSTYAGQSSIVTVGTLTGGATGAGFTVALTTSTVTGTLTVTNGGTGLTAVTAHYVTIGNGTSALTLLAPSSRTNSPLCSQGSSADPAYDLSAVGGYILLQDQKTVTTNGGTFNPASGWVTRALTEIADTGNDCSVSSNQFTLTAGTYEIRASAPAFNVNQHQIRLQNVTDTATVLVGSSEFASSAGNVQSHSWIVGRFTIAASKALEIQHQCAGPIQNTNGLGVAANLTTEIYTTVFLRRVS